MIYAVTGKVYCSCRRYILRIVIMHYKYHLCAQLCNQSMFSITCYVVLFIVCYVCIAAYLICTVCTFPKYTGS